MTIARIWRAITLATDADKFLEYLDRSVIPAHRIAEGNEGFFVMQECQGELTHFLLLSFWTSNEALAGLTGVVSSEGMNLTPEVKSLLVAFESTAKCYKVVC